MCIASSLSLSLHKIASQALAYRHVANKPRTTAIATLATVPCLSANALAAPVKVAVGPSFVLEALSPVVPVGLAPVGLAPDGLAPDGLAPDGLAPDAPPAGGSTDGETFSGAFFASSVKLSMVRDLFCAGLLQRIQHSSRLETHLWRRLTD